MAFDVLPRPAATGTRPPQQAPRPLPTRQRRPAAIGLAVLLVVGSGLAGMKLLDSESARTPVLVAARPVAAGHVIGAKDVKEAEIAGGVRAILAGDSSTVVGKVASVDLVRGQVLNRDMLSSAAVPSAGHALVGMSLKPTQVPGDGLEPGDSVDLVAVPAGGDGDLGEPTVLATSAKVFATAADASATGSTLVSVIVADGEANRVVAYAGLGRIALVKKPARR